MRKAAKCQECGSNDHLAGSFPSGMAATILHEKTCSKHVSNILEARKEFIEQRVRDQSGPSHRICKPQPSGEKMEESAKIRKLKEKLEGLKSIVVNSLIAIDWTVKLGLAVSLWFFPVVQDRLIQSAGIIGYVFLLTLISKAITKAESYEITVED
mgnify:CR=1 FL=1